ncbi:LOW QUALITY PROTEIN: hypothetical protein HID58_070277 [Brassica napus]|uniref:Uncharacterized protein n=1 Tax=Brassica napus TaxID=3708 RepID=A0ABQ7YYB3_BRANA|nr:LOW QUALITY PROTEIN: hypothetical protein HID58_070277 [Brassica napus]
MAHDELPEATQREAELQRQVDDLQDTNPELSSEFQILKEKLDEHSKQLEQSAENLSQLESENLTLRDENQALNASSNNKRRFRTQISGLQPGRNSPIDVTTYPKLSLVELLAPGKPSCLAPGHKEGVPHYSISDEHLLEGPDIISALVDEIEDRLLADKAALASPGGGV